MFGYMGSHRVIRRFALASAGSALACMGFLAVAPGSEGAGGVALRRAVLHEVKADDVPALGNASEEGDDVVPGQAAGFRCACGWNHRCIERINVE